MSVPHYENIDVANNMLHQAERDREAWEKKARFLASVLLARFDYDRTFTARSEEELRPLSSRLSDARAMALEIRGTR